jgi:putative ABC transport system permease protein
MWVVLRTSVGPNALVAAIRREIRHLDADQPIARIATMGELLEESQSVAPRRSQMFILVAFAILAVVLAAIGVYGVMSYSVSQRAHEFGIRMALGATQRDVLALILHQGLALSLKGIAVGLLGAAALTRFLSSLLFGVSANDVATFVGASVMLACVALLASYLPARRATKLDPIETLKYE